MRALLATCIVAIWTIGLLTTAKAETCASVTAPE